MAPSAGRAGRNHTATCRRIFGTPASHHTEIGSAWITDLYGSSNMTILLNWLLSEASQFIFCFVLLGYVKHQNKELLGTCLSVTFGL